MSESFTPSQWTFETVHPVTHWNSWTKDVLGIALRSASVYTWGLWTSPLTSNRYSDSEIFGVRAGDRVDPEAVPTREQATQPGPEGVPDGILDFGTEDDSRGPQHPHAEKDSASHGDLGAGLPLCWAIRRRSHSVSLGMLACRGGSGTAGACDA